MRPYTHHRSRSCLLMGLFLTFACALCSADPSHHIRRLSKSKPISPGSDFGNVLNYDNDDETVRLTTTESRPPDADGRFYPGTKIAFKITTGQAGYLFLLNQDEKEVQLVGWDGTQPSFEDTNALVSRYSVRQRSVITFGNNATEIQTSNRNGVEIWRAILFTTKQNALAFANAWKAGSQGNHPVSMARLAKAPWQGGEVNAHNTFTASITYRVRSKVGNAEDSNPDGDTLFQPLTLGVMEFESLDPAGGQRGIQYTRRFHTALLKYVKTKYPGLKVVTGKPATMTLKGQVAHIQDSNTPFVVTLRLLESQKAKPVRLVAYWAGRANSVFLFDNQMRNAHVHPQGLAGDVGDRLIQVLQILERQNQMATLLPQLPVIKALPKQKAADGSWRAMAHGRAIPSRGTLEVDVTPLGGQTLFVAQRSTGEWVLLGSTSHRLTIESSILLGEGNSVNVWMITTPNIQEDNAPKQRPEERQMHESDTRSAIAVLSGVPELEQNAEWIENPILDRLFRGQSRSTLSIFRFQITRGL